MPLLFGRPTNAASSIQKTESNTVKTRRKLLLGTVAICVVVAAAVMARARTEAHRLITNPAATRKLPRITPAQFQMPFDEVLITNADGLRLAGWYVPSRNRAAILAQHGLKMTREEMLPAAAALYRHGYGVLLCSVRAHDRSDGEQITFGIREVRDLEAWYHYLVTRPDVDPGRIGALGNSMGGSLVIQFAAGNTNIKAVAADSPFSSLDDTVATSVTHFTGLPAFPFAPLMLFWAKLETGCDLSQVNAKVWIRQLSPRPILLMQGGADTTVSGQSGARLFAAAGEPKELWYEPSVGHAQFATLMPAYEQRLVAFFDRALGNSRSATSEKQHTAAQPADPSP